MARAESWGLQELTVLGIFGRGAKLTRYAVCTETGFSTSTVYDIIGRFEAHGYVRGERERVNPQVSDRAPKLIYRGTTVALDQLHAIRLLLTTA